MVSEETILKYALQNAVLHNGEAQAGAIIGKLIAADPAVKAEMKTVGKLVAAVISKVNKMAPDEQLAELEKLAPELLEKKAKEEHKELPELEGAEPGKVVTRFAPFPSGALHIGNMKAAIISYLYAKKYDGKFIVRLEDTDPTKMRQEYVDYIKADLELVGLKPDLFYLLSDHFETYYKYAWQLVNEGKAYVCICKATGIKDKKATVKKGCPCEELTTSEHHTRFQKMFEDCGEGEAVLRLRAFSSDKNQALRNPALMRINTTPHCLKGTKYRVYPLYNFSCAIEDSQTGVTHVLRAVEHATNTIIQQEICKQLGIPPSPHTISFGFLYLEGSDVHKRHIREGIADGTYSDWDDIKLGEHYGIVRALIRRGILPQTLKDLMVQLGISPQLARVSWDMIYSANRKLLDPTANRYFFVAEPAVIDVEMPARKVSLPNHPDFPERGRRTFAFGEGNHSFYLDSKDLQAAKLRLIELFNIEKNEKWVFAADQQNTREIPKVQWVERKTAVPTRLIMPDGTVKEGFTEEAVAKLKPGEIVQFVRVGFVRLDHVEDGTPVFYFAHK